MKMESEFTSPVCYTSSKTLCLSSLVFLTNVAVGLYTGHIWYAVLFGCLTLTSLVFHSTKNTLAKYADQFVIFLIFLYGGYQLYHKMTPENRFESLVIVGTFLTTVFLYFYGYASKQYCYCPEQCIADRYHSALQWVASLGHNMIMLL
jgi:uncharacterized membrane protein YGL010W